MGCWGTGNFENDDAAMRAGMFLDALIKDIEGTAANETLMEADEPTSSIMLADIDLLCQLGSGPQFADHIGRSALPTVETARAWKKRYLSAWDRTIDDLDPSADFVEQRRKVIARTFDRLARLAKKCPWVCEPKAAPKEPPDEGVLFEGLTITGPGDVRRQPESTNYQAGDHYPWGWVKRFCKAHPEHAAWVDEALEAEVRAAMTGDEFKGKKIGTAWDIYRMASGMGRLLPGTTGILRRQIIDHAADYRIDKAEQILDTFCGMDAEIDEELGQTILKLGMRPRCFEVAISVFSDEPRWEAQLVVQGLASAIESKKHAADVLERVALFYAVSDGEPYRADIAAAIAKIPAKVRQRARALLAAAQMDSLPDHCVMIDELLARAD